MMERNSALENDLIIDSHIVEMVTGIKYLGSIIITQMNCDKEVKRRLGMARKASRKH